MVQENARGTSILVQPVTGSNTAGRNLSRRTRIQTQVGIFPSEPRTGPHEPADPRSVRLASGCTGAAIPTRARAWPGRDGGRVPRDRHDARPPGRHQGGAPGAGRPPIDRSPVPGRGPHHRPAPPPQHRRRSHRRHGRRPPLLRHGRSRRGEPPPASHPGGPTRSRRCRAHRGRCRGRARCGRPCRGRAPGCEARERPARPAHRARAPGGLRHRSGHGGRGQREYRAGRGGRHSGLHEPRAGGRRRGGPPQRPLRAGHRRVRDAGRPPAVPGSQPRGGLQAHRRAPGADRSDLPRLPASAGRGDHEGAGEASRRAVAERRGASSGDGRRAPASRAERPAARSRRGSARGRGGADRRGGRTGPPQRRSSGRRESAAFDPGAPLRQPPGRSRGGVAARRQREHAGAQPVAVERSVGGGPRATARPARPAQARRGRGDRPRHGPPPGPRSRRLDRGAGRLRAGRRLAPSRGPGLRRRQRQPGERGAGGRPAGRRRAARVRPAGHGAARPLRRAGRAAGGRGPVDDGLAGSVPRLSRRGGAAQPVEPGRGGARPGARPDHRHHLRPGLLQAGAYPGLAHRHRGFHRHPGHRPGHDVLRQPADSRPHGDQRLSVVPRRGVRGGAVALPAAADAGPG